MHCKRPWCWEILRAGEEEYNRGWDDWLASSNQWIWVWADLGDGEGRRSQVCCYPWSHKESDMTKWTTATKNFEQPMFPEKMKGRERSKKIKMGWEDVFPSWNEYVLQRGNLLNVMNIREVGRYRVWCFLLLLLLLFVCLFVFNENPEIKGHTQQK